MSQFLAKRLFDASPVILNMSEYYDPIKTWADTLEERKKIDHLYAFRRAQAIVIEYAMVKLGYILNPMHYNGDDRTTYAFDNIDPVNGMTFDCKRIHGENWSVDAKHTNTLHNNRDIVDFIVGATLDDDKVNYFVNFKLLARTSTFKKYMKPSRYENYSHYFDYKTATRLGDAWHAPIRSKK